MAKPNLFILGVMKCGTSSLHQVLAQHPDIWMSRCKELNFFSRAKHPPLSEYEAHFDCPRPVRFRGESTPSYSAHPEALRQIREYCPSARLILVLRDPVKRAISHYQHRCRVVGEPNPIWQELKTDLQEEGKHRCKAYLHWSRSYHLRGRYHETVANIHHWFEPEQLLILRLEDLIADSGGQFARISAFLDIADFAAPSLPMLNSGAYAQAHDEVVPYLAQYYRPHNEILAERFGISLAGWTAG